MEYRLECVDGFSFYVPEDFELSPFSQFLMESIQFDSSSDSVSDIGSGKGILSIFLAKKGGGKIVGVEADHQICVESRNLIQANNMCSTVSIVEGRFEDYPNLFQASAVVCNPPTMPMSPSTPSFTWGGEDPLDFLVGLLSMSQKFLSDKSVLNLVLSSILGEEKIRCLFEDYGLRILEIKQKPVPVRDFYYKVYEPVFLEAVTEQIFENPAFKEFKRMKGLHYECLTYYSCGRNK